MTKERVKIKSWKLSYEMRKHGMITFRKVLELLDIDRNGLNYRFKKGFIQDIDSEEDELQAICNMLDIKEEKLK